MKMQAMEEDANLGSEYLHDMQNPEYDSFVTGEEAYPMNSDYSEDAQ